MHSNTHTHNRPKFYHHHVFHSIRMPEFWTKFTEVQFEFSNWSLPNYPGKDEDLANPVFYEFRASDIYKSDLQESALGCSYYLGSFATNGSAVDLDTGGDEYSDGSFVVTVGPEGNKAFINATAAGLASATNNGRQWAIMMTVVNAQCTSRQSELMSSYTTVRWCVWARRVFVGRVELALCWKL